MLTAISNSLPSSSRGMESLVSCLTRLVMKRWRYCLVVFILVAIPVLILQWVMLEEERAKYDKMSRFGAARRDLFNRDWATSGAVPELLSRALRYCNMPVTMGLEGKLNHSLGGLRLVAVFVVVRHGDRAPLLEYPNFRYRLECDLESLKGRRDLLLNEMLGVLRRTPLLRRGIFANRTPFPNETTCSRGRMTPQGVLQNFLLGNHLRNAYPDLLSELHIPDDLHVELTHSDRTFHSAVALLQSLLRDRDRRVKPEYRVSNNVVFCNPAKFDCQCPKLRLHFAETKVAMGKLLSAKEVISLRYAFGDFLGFSADGNPPNVEDLVDALMPLVCHRYRGSLCVGSRCLPHLLVHQLWRVHDRNGQHLAHEPSVIKFCKLAMFPFLKETLMRMRAAGREGGKAPKFALFSGHDHTVRYLLTALGLYDGSWPPLSSRVVFEVYKARGRNRRYFRLLYNGEVLTHVLSFCREEICPVEKFAAFLKEDFWLPFGTTKPCS